MPDMEKEELEIKDDPDMTPPVEDDTEEVEDGPDEDAEVETVMEDGPEVAVPAAMAPAGKITVLDKKVETVVEPPPAPFAFKGPFMADGCDVRDNKNVRVMRCGTDSNRVMNGPRIAIEAAKAMNKAFP